MDETKLIEGLKRGDYTSYETLFSLYYVRFVNFADKLIRDRHASKDLVQEAFMKVWLNREKLDASLSMGNYLYVLVKRAVLNFLRDRRYAETLVNQHHEHLAQVAAPDTPAEARDMLRRIRDCVEQMPPQRRRVFLMSRREALTNKEIASKLSLSEKTVERHITLALTELRKKYSS